MCPQVNIHRVWTFCGAFVVSAGCSLLPLDELSRGDAGADAAREAGAEASGCATVMGAQFCDDFDDPRDLPRDWTQQEALGGSLALSNAGAFSPPRVLVVEALAANPGENHAHVRLQKTFAARPSEVHLELQVRAEPTPGALAIDAGMLPPNAKVASISLGADDGSSYSVAYATTPPGRALLAENTFDAMTQVSIAFAGDYDYVAPSPRVWTRVTVDLVKGADAGAATITLRLDGKVVLTRATLPSTALTNGKLAITVGLPQSNVLPHAVVVDDVVVRHR